MSHVKDNAELESDCSYVGINEQEDTNNMKTIAYQPKKQHGKSVMLSIIAGVWYAFANFFIGEKANLGFLTVFVSCLGTLIFGLAIILYRVVIKCKKNEAIWTWEESYFRHPKGGLNKFNTAIIVSYTAYNMLIRIILVFCFNFALVADINQGILTTLFGLTAFFSAWAAYFLFNERLKIAHIIGMILMLFCIAGIGFGSSSKNSTSEAIEEELDDTLSTVPIQNTSSSRQIVYTFLSILFAILCAIGFCTGGMIVKISHKGPKQKSDHDYTFKTVNGTDIYIISNAICNIFYIALTIVIYQVGSHPFYGLEYIQIASVGIIGSLGVVFMNRALILGYSGPVFALCNTQVIIQTILNVIFLGQVPSIIEIIAAIIGIIGSCIIALFS